MFTGIIEETGIVTSLSRENQVWHLRIQASKVLEGAAIGDSIAVNGCCLTVVGLGDGQVRFDVLEETLRKTSFRQLAVGAKVNLERSLAFNGKMGGHFVTGHVDATGTIAVIEPRGQDTYLRIQAPAEFLRYLVYKGSIAIDGISLTVAQVHADGFEVWLIPHTVAVTNLCQRKAGDAVNLEFDILAKYVERLVATKA